jgi:hypothetical protein
LEALARRRERRGRRKKAGGDGSKKEKKSDATQSTFRVCRGQKKKLDPLCCSKRAKLESIDFLPIPQLE